MAVSLHDHIILQICQAAKKNHMAVSFGYIEKAGGSIFSSQIVIDSDGAIIHNYHRVSPGWKEHFAGAHYVEGSILKHFSMEKDGLLLDYAAICGRTAGRRK